MPLYEYVCEKCELEFEVLASMTAPMPPCPECGERCRRKISRTNFSLSGSGWYSDHYGLKTTKPPES